MVLIKMLQKTFEKTKLRINRGVARVIFQQKTRKKSHHKSLSDGGYQALGGSCYREDR